jgi:hypothetical protein
MVSILVVNASILRSVSTNVHLEMDSFGSAYPVSLHGNYPFRPSVKIVEAVYEFLCIICYPNKPLFQSALNYRRAAAPTDAFSYDLFVCKNCFAVFAPVDGGVLAVYKSFLIELEEKPLVPFIVITLHVSTLRLQS